MIQDRTKSASSATALAGPELHEEWSARYRTDESEAAFDAAFDRILETFAAPAGATILDAGCGTGSHSIRLARRGYTVEAVDFSEYAVEQARANASREGLSQQIRFRRSDLLDLPFEDGRFRYGICWGVLLHVPKVERAIAELCRVIGRGGMLAVSETNMRSVQTLALRAVRRIKGSADRDIGVTPAGIEKWRPTSSGELVTRQSDVPWLMREFAAGGLVPRARWAGDFTDVYTRIGSRALRQAIHRFNGLWFRHVGRGGPAAGNILVFERP